MASDALEPKETVPPSFLIAAAVDDAPPEVAALPPAIELAALVMAEEAEPAAEDAAPPAALEVEEVAAPADAPADDVPVQAERIGSAAALATPAPSIRNMFRRFMLLFRNFESKSELVTIGLQIYTGRLSTPRSDQTLSLRRGEVTIPPRYGLVTITFRGKSRW